MNDIAMPVADAAASATELTLLATENPLVILQDPEKFDAFYERVHREVADHVPDLTTDKGRKAIASLAFKVVKTKTALDDAGKKLTEDKRKEIAAVDAARKNIRDKLDALRDEVRAPLTKWEEEEELRVFRCQAVLADLKQKAVISIDDTSEGVAARLAEVEALAITAAEFGDLFDFATDSQALAVNALRAGVERLAKEEADRAELARLREEQEARAAREAEDAATRQREEAEAAEARRREQEAAARAETERVAAEERERSQAEAAAQATRDAEARAREEAEARATQEREAQEREHQASLAEERRQREVAEAESRRLADEQAQRDAAARAEREAAEARAKNIEHRGGIMKAAKEAIMEHGVVEEAEAKAIVLAIAAGSVPHVSIQF